MVELICKMVNLNNKICISIVTEIQHNEHQN